MKSLFYFLSIVAIGAAGFFGWSAKKNYEQQIVDRDALIDSNKRLSKSINEQTQEKITRTEQRKVALAEEAEAVAGLEAAQAKGREFQNTLESIQANLDEANAKKKEIDDAIAELRKKVPGIELEEVPAEVKRLEAKVKKLEAERQDAEVVKSGLEEDVAKNLAEIGRLEEKIEESILRVSGNVFQATITAVDNNWNFVMIGAGEKSGLTGDSRLLVQRGGRLIAKLFITKLEANTAVADVEPGSLRSGVIIQPGDQVILAKVRAN